MKSFQILSNPFRILSRYKSLIIPEVSVVSVQILSKNGEAHSLYIYINKKKEKDSRCNGDSREIYGTFEEYCKEKWGISRP